MSLSLPLQQQQQRLRGHLTARLLLLLGLIFLWPTAALAQTADEAVLAEETPVLSEREARLAETRLQLDEMQRSLDELRTRADQLRRQMGARNLPDEEREEVQQLLLQVEAQRRNLRASFESIALSGLDLSLFDDARSAQQEFNWQEELLTILRPLFSEMRQLTERPRTIERLRSERALINQRLYATEQALVNLAAVNVEDLSAATRSRLKDLEQSWSERLSELQRQRNMVQLQLDNLLAQEHTWYQQAWYGASEFFVGRGMTLLLAVFSFLALIVLLQGGMNQWLRYRARKHKVRRSIKVRLFILGYRLFTGLLAVLVFLMVLYAAGDLVMFALALLVVIALLLSFRSYLPRYLNEAKLFLNAGQVREGERVIYRGIPWQINSIGFYARLVNPELDNGVIRLPLSELSQLVSRPVPHDEPWFPTRPGEFIMLPDGTFALVERQTPEIVQLKVRNNAVYYATSDFLANRPRNLSRGSFVVIGIFGIDYSHQDIALDVVPEVFQAAVQKELAESVVAEHVEDLLVEFKDAGESSLNYLIVVTVNGGAAGQNFKVERIIQSACVRTCNEQGWIIPFRQITVHQGEGFERLHQRLPSTNDR